MPISFLETNQKSLREHPSLADIPEQAKYDKDIGIGSIPLWQIYSNRQNTIRTIKQTVEGKP
jgi:hypothetical protein